MDDEASRRFRGSVARKGARVVGEPPDARRAGGDRTREVRPARDEWEPEVWVEERPVDRPPAPPTPPARRPRQRAALSDSVRSELTTAVGTGRVARFHERLAEAVQAYERDRYQDALRLLRPLAQAAPTAPTVRELHGLTLYRLGRWTAAIRELEAFHALSGSYDQHPVLADCHRAARRWREVDAVWEELRRASPAPEVLTEGRIVLAGARADRGDLAGAIEVLERARTKVGRPRLHHLRLWYALADLYERAGELPRARALFRAVADADPGFVDVAERVAGLG